MPAEYTCQYCGKTFYRDPSRAKHGRGIYCSRDCQYSSAKGTRGATEVITFTCLNCGKSFTLYTSRVRDKKGAGKYCCRKCRDEHWHSENHPHYIDGNGTNWHGPNWYSQRRKALKRDLRTCQHCQLTEAESLGLYEQPLAVHHIKPFRLFADYKEANALSNLITLCHSCHRIAEAEILF